MTDTPMWNWAEQLLGLSNVRPPTEHGCRWLRRASMAWDPLTLNSLRVLADLCTLPDTETASLPDQLHTDGHPFHFGAICLLEDCPPDSGAFKVWPAVIVSFIPFPMQYDQARIPFYEHLPSKRHYSSGGYLEAVPLNPRSSLYCWGSQGDVVLWHHRLGRYGGPSQRHRDLHPTSALV